MSPKHTISTEAQVLLRLLRIALGTEPMTADGSLIEPFPPSIDWSEVIRLSYEQKVSALAVDGLKASKYGLYEGLNDQQTEELRQKITPWIDDVANIEEGYAYYVNVLNTLSQIFATHGLKMVVLKGYGLSLNYPMPSHRGLGDIDICLVDEQGDIAAAAGDTILSQLGIEIYRENDEKHSKCSFKGITIENHYQLREGIIKDNKENDYLSLLNSMLPEHIVQIEGINVYQPSPTLNTLLLLRHMLGDQHRNVLKLRQICDWALFINKFSNEIDIPFVKDIFNKVGFDEYFHLINEMTARWLKIDLPVSFNCQAETRDKADYLLSDITNPVQWGNTYFGHIRYFCKRQVVNYILTGQGWMALVMKAFVKGISQKLGRSHP